MYTVICTEEDIDNIHISFLTNGQQEDETVVSLRDANKIGRVIAKWIGTGKV